MININSYTQGAGVSSLSTASETVEKKLSNEKEIVSVNNTLAELTISSNTPFLTDYNINEKKTKEPDIRCIDSCIKTVIRLPAESAEKLRGKHNLSPSGLKGNNSPQLTGEYL